jgi:hypothetical protein
MDMKALIEARINGVREQRKADKLGVIVYGLEYYPEGWTAYASTVEKRDQWIAQYRARGLRAEIA